MLRNIKPKSIVKSFMYKYFLLFIHLIYALVEQLSDPTHIVFVNHISKINLLEIITFHLQFVYYLRVISTLKFRCQNTVYMNFRKLLYCFKTANKWNQTDKLGMMCAFIFILHKPCENFKLFCINNICIMAGNAPESV